MVVSFSASLAEHWQLLWLVEAFWHVLYFGLLLCIALLWSPSQNNIQYAYSEQVVFEEEDVLVMEKEEQEQQQEEERQLEGDGDTEASFKSSGPLPAPTHGGIRARAPSAGSGERAVTDVGRRGRGAQRWAT